MLSAASPLIATDWLVIAAYFLLVFAVAAWVTFGRKGTHESSSGYFLAGRSAGWFVIGASLFASNIGSEHLIGLAGAGADSGVPVAHYEIWASIILLLLGWVFAPFYLKSGVYTMPEFLERRYSPAARWYLAMISVVAYVLTKISVTILAGGIVFKVLMGFDSIWIGALIVVVATGAYTVFGGLKAVLYTDMLQMIILVGGAIVVTWFGLEKLGGWSVVQETAAPKGFLNMWRPSDHGDFPWTGMMIGAPILGVWYWCTDQYIVQRVLSARNLDNARTGTIFGGFLKLLPLFIFVVPGIVAYCLKAQGHLDYKASNDALPALIAAVLPAGLRGLVVAGFLAALMSSLSTVFNSCSTIITWDIYKKLKPNASERSLVWVGQTSTIVMVVIGILWIPMMERIDNRLFIYLQSVQAYISPPIAAIFLLGLLLPRLNGAGAMAAIVLGFILGAGRFLFEIVKGGLPVAGGETTAMAFTAKYGELLGYLVNMHFLHFAIVMFVVCSFALILASLLAPPKSARELENLTFFTVPAADPSVVVSSRSRAKEIALSVLLVACVVGLWVWFS